MDTLSYDLVCHILSYLPYAEVQQFLCTCATYACYRKDNLFWRRYIVTNYSEDFPSHPEESISSFVNFIDTKLDSLQRTWTEVAHVCRYKAGHIVPKDNGTYDQQMFSMPLSYANGSIIRTIFGRVLVISTNIIAPNISMERVLECNYNINDIERMEFLYIDSVGNLRLQGISNGSLPFSICQGIVDASTVSWYSQRYFAAADHQRRIFYTQHVHQYASGIKPDEPYPFRWKFLIQAPAKIRTITLLHVQDSILLYFLTEHRWLYCGVICEKSFVLLYKEPEILALDKCGSTVSTLSSDGKIHIRRESTKHFITTKDYRCIDGVYHIVSKQERFFRLHQFLAYRYHRSAYFIRLLN